MTTLEKKQFIMAHLQQASPELVEEMWLVMQNFDTKNADSPQDTFEKLLDQTTTQYKKVWEALA